MISAVRIADKIKSDDIFSVGEFGPGGGGLVSVLAAEFSTAFEQIFGITVYHNVHAFVPGFSDI